MIRIIVILGFILLIFTIGNFKCYFHNVGGSGSETPNVNYIQARKQHFTISDSVHLPNENHLIDTTCTLKEGR